MLAAGRLPCMLCGRNRKKGQMAKRFITRIELTPATRSRLTEISLSNGMTQVALLSRIVNWFADQPDVIQAGVLGRYPAELQPDIAKLILDRMVKTTMAKA
jgi:hypothetical protein